MSSSFEKPVIRKELWGRLPRTFRPVLNDYLLRWDQLFPAEQRPIRATLDHLGALSAEELDDLLAPIRRVEAKMDLTSWPAEAHYLSIEATSVLARSPAYPEWRREVERLFDRIERRVGAFVTSRSHKLVVSIVPSGLPLTSQPLWPRLARRGRWFQLERPFVAEEEGLLRRLAARRPLPESDRIEQTWVLQSAKRPIAYPEAPGLTVLCYEALEAAREVFRRRMNEIEKDLRAADETFDSLRHLKIDFLVPPPVDQDVRLREFVRDLFLSGNGAVLFCNSFIQWGAHEAMRRVQPQALVCYFGLRNKLKPFSSLVLFEDQNRANPVPDEPDPDGSLTDIQFLCDYLYLNGERLESYRGRTLYLFAAADSDLMLVLAPASFGGLPAPGVTEIDFDKFLATAVVWLETA